MKKLTLLASLFLLICPAILIADATVGEPAPAFTLTDSRGATHSLADFKGKVVVLEWFNNECPFVVKHYGSGNMQKLQKKYVGEDVVWLTINSSASGKQGHVDPSQANELITKNQAAQTAFLLDANGAVGKAYGARTTPHMFVIDGDGVLRYAGAIDSNSSSRADTIPEATNYVVNAVDSIKSGKSVDPAVTEPYGCSVKYAD